MRRPFSLAHRSLSPHTRRGLLCIMEDPMASSAQKNSDYTTAHQSTIHCALIERETTEEPCRSRNTSSRNRAFCGTCPSPWKEPRPIVEPVAAKLEPATQRPPPVRRLEDPPVYAMTKEREPTVLTEAQLQSLRARLTRLTRTEQQVYRRILAGQTVEAMATAMEKPVGSVKVVISNIKNRLGVPEFKSYPYRDRGPLRMNVLRQIGPIA